MQIEYKAFKRNDVYLILAQVEIAHKTYVTESESFLVFPPNEEQIVYACERLAKKVLQFIEDNPQNIEACKRNAALRASGNWAW